MPRSKGSFSQYWDIQSKSTTGKPNNESNTIRLQLSGQVNVIQFLYYFWDMLMEQLSYKIRQ